MKFVHPEFLWALFAISIPIIIHLFNFRRYKTLYFSSLTFVQNVENQTKSTQKLRNILLLLLRIIVISALVIAFAQPFFPTTKNTNATTENIVAIHIDNSYSMTMRGAEGELLSEAIETARRLLNDLSLDSKIILSTNTISGIESRVTTKIEALNRLDNITPSVMSRDFSEVIQWQKNFVANHPSVSHHNIQHIYLSDFQQHNFDINQLKADTSNSYFPFVFVPQDRSNLSVDSVWFDSPLQKLGSTNELFIQVHNHGNESMQNLEMNVSIGSVDKTIFFDIDDNNSSIASLSFTNKEIGVIEGKIQLTDNQFYADDDYYFTYEVKDHSSILVLDGSNAEPSVSKVFSLDEFYHVETINIKQYTQDLLMDKDLILLNGVNEIPNGITENLVAYSNSGGSIAYFPGASVDFASVSHFLASFSLPVFTKQTSQNGRIKSLNYDDPFFHGVFDEKKENLSLPGVNTFYLTNQSSSAKSLPIVQLQSGQPLLYRTDGAKQVFVYTGILGKDYGSFVNDILYPTTLLRIGQLSQRSAPLQLTIGRDGNYPIYNTSSSEAPFHLQSGEIDYIPQMAIIGGVNYLQLKGNQTIEHLQPSIYTIKQNDQVHGKLALNIDKNESLLNYVSFEDINEALAKHGITQVGGMKVNDGVSSTPIGLNKPAAYWKLFIALALLALLAEMIIIKYWKIQHN